jgi:hypothetical protein
MMYRYCEIDKDNHLIYPSYSKKQLTYPRALRFESARFATYYRDAKREFVQSTKIPATCIDCPIHLPCLLELDGRECCGITECRLTWRKIWEYVK